MRALPLNIGPIHFVGIGGIGMSGIAQVLHNLGYHVQGSDVAEGYNIARLREAGMQVHIGHEPPIWARPPWSSSPPPSSATTRSSRRRESA